MNCVKCKQFVDVTHGKWVEVSHRESHYLGDHSEVILTKKEIVCAECYASAEKIEQEDKLLREMLRDTVDAARNLLDAHKCADHHGGDEVPALIMAVVNYGRMNAEKGPHHV